jgi:hypothetical protein
VLLRNGDGTFRTAVTYASGGFDDYSVAVADVNGDGKPDLLVANLGCANGVVVAGCPGGVVGVLLGNGDGSFQPVVTYNSGGYQALSLVVADVNRDGKPDIVVANGCVTDLNCYGVVGVLLGNGDGTFRTAVTYNSGGYEAFSIVVADVNGDGKPDLLVANACPSQCSTATDTGTLGVLLGNGDGTFQSALTYGSGGIDGRMLAVADVNQDGKPDVVVANVTSCNFCDGSVGILLGNGNGTFGAPVAYDTGACNTNALAVADVNGDGKPDIVVANQWTNYANHQGTVGVLINATPTIDITPPVITISANPTTLWPPDGKMMSVTLSGAITDTGSGLNANSAAYAIIDQYGQVQPTGRLTVDSGGRYSFIVLLQAARAGTDYDGRQYTITVSAKDNAGNLGSASTVVTVPHDQRN